MDPKIPRWKLQFPRNLIFQGWRVHEPPGTIFATEAAERRRPRPFFPSSQEVIETNTLAETSVFRLLAFFFWFKSGSIWKLNELCPPRGSRKSRFREKLSNAAEPWTSLACYQASFAFYFFHPPPWCNTRWKGEKASKNSTKENSSFERIVQRDDD